MDRNYPGTGFGDLGAGAGWSYERSAKARYASDSDNVHASLVLCGARRDPCKQNCRRWLHLWSHAFPLCVVHCHPNSCIVILFKHDRSRVRVVGVGGVEKGKVGDSNCVIDRRGF